MLAVRLLNQVEALGDQKVSNAVTGHEGEAGFEEIQAAERRELVQHHQQTVALRVICGLIQPLRQATPDLVEDQTDQWLGAADVRRRDDEIEGQRPIGFDQILDPPVTTGRNLCDGWIAINRSEEHTSELPSLMSIP